VNSSPRKSAGSSDLIPGIAASATLLLMFLLLKFIPLWVGIGLAIGVYIGVKFLLPTPQPEVIPVESTPAILADVQQLAGRIPAGSARLQLRNIVDIAEGLLRYGDAHPDQASDSLSVLRQYLDSLRTGIRRYLETLRYTPDSAQQSQQTLSELLETVSDSLKRLHSGLVEKETADLTGDLRALNRTLQEMDRVWLNLGEKKE
jgi:hypothetical protein